MTAAGPWLVGDVGGTNARFALVEEPGAAPSGVRVLPTRDFTDLGEAAAAYLADETTRPAAACLAVAGPVGGGDYHLTNAAWKPGSVADVRERLGLPVVKVVNDFAALAASLPSLGTDDVRPVGGGAAPAPDGTAPLAVLGPGTGMGVAGLVPAPGPGGTLTWIPTPGEGGHVDPPAVTDEEIEVVRLLRAEHGAASAELLLSGGGLARVHRLLAAVRGTTVEPLPPRRIVERLDDPRCADAVGVFCALLGSFAGNVALTLGARGGVYLGGGILPRIVDALEASDFRARFETKPPVEDYLRAIPTALIVHPYPALLGAAAYLARTVATATLETV